jgi:anthranilate synthase component I
MFSISKENFIKQAELYQTVALSVTVVADTKTPIQLFRLFDEEASFLLESKDPLSPWSSYSFIGLNPVKFLRDENETFVCRSSDNQKLWSESDLQTAWEKVMDSFHISPVLPDLPFPGGAVGYLGFEGFRYYEPRIQTPQSGEHDAYFMFCETILAFHHEDEVLTVTHFQDTSGGAEAAYAEASERLHEILNSIEKGKDGSFPMISADEQLQEDIFAGVTSNYTKSGYEKDVRKIKEYIAQGDVFQTVLSQRFELPVKSDGLSLYRVLRKVNPSPYLYYIRFPEQEIIGSSPERLVKADKTKELEIHPIAGTRKRGRNSEEDQALAKELAEDEKELAEHLMLVDLARNDLGRVSRYGSIRVHDMMNISYFSHVMHLTTKVTGILKENIHPFEALFSTHPAGTVSGAPKVRAVEIIQELENMHRGVYAGAIAYYGFNKAIDSCIAIRTIVLKNGTAYVQAGAGVVQDSVPELEWEETRNKAKALLFAIKLAEQRLEKEEVINNDTR